MKKRTKIRITVISALVFGFILGIATMHNATQQCVADPTFNRVECCHKLTTTGRCATGQRVTVYNV